MEAYKAIGRRTKLYLYKLPNELQADEETLFPTSASSPVGEVPTIGLGFAGMNIASAGMDRSAATNPIPPSVIENKQHHGLKDKAGASTFVLQGSSSDSVGGGVSKSSLSGGHSSPSDARIDLPPSESSAPQRLTTTFRSTSRSMSSPNLNNDDSSSPSSSTTDNFPFPKSVSGLMTRSPNSSDGLAHSP